MHRNVDWAITVHVKTKVSIFKTKTKQKRNKITTKSQQNHKKNIVKYKTKQIKTHKDTANQIQAFTFFFVSVLICCDFVFVLINGHLSFDMYCRLCKQCQLRGLLASC
jgi:hypothetical protein